MQVDGQLKSAQLELIQDDSPLPAPLGRIYMDTTGGTKAVPKIQDLNRFSKLLTDNSSFGAKTANYTLSLDDEIVLCSAAGGSFAVTLPPAATAIGKKFTICRTDSVVLRDVTVTPDSPGETVDGTATFILKTKNDCITILSNGTVWILLSHTWDTSPQAYTPIADWIANATLTGYYQRTGKCIAVDINVALTGAPTAATLNVYLPPGLQIDTTVMTDATQGQQFFPGNVFIYDTSATEKYHGWAAYSSADALMIFKDDGDGTVSVVNATAPVTFANGDAVRIRVAEIPIIKLR